MQFALFFAKFAYSCLTCDSIGFFLQALSKITSTGAMTFCFIQAIERGEAATYGSILNSMRTTIRNTGGGASIAGGGAVTSLISMLLTGGSGGTGGLKQVTFWGFANASQYIPCKSVFAVCFGIIMCVIKHFLLKSCSIILSVCQQY
jgi:hypothetical protein